MLNFQTADYCLLVWDGDNTEPDKAIEDLRNTLKERESGFKAISIFVPDYECTDIDEMNLLNDMLKSIISAMACLEYNEYTPLDKLRSIIHSCLAILLCNIINTGSVEAFLNQGYISIKTVGGNENHDKTD